MSEKAGAFSEADILSALSYRQGTHGFELDDTILAQKRAHRKEELVELGFAEVFVRAQSFARSKEGPQAALFRLLSSPRASLVALRINRAYEDATTEQAQPRVSQPCALVDSCDTLDVIPLFLSQGYSFVCCMASQLLDKGAQFFKQASQQRLVIFPCVTNSQELQELCAYIPEGYPVLSLVDEKSQHPFVSARELKCHGFEPGLMHDISSQEELCCYAGEYHLLFSSCEELVFDNERKLPYKAFPLTLNVRTEGVQLLEAKIKSLESCGVRQLLDAQQTSYTLALDSFLQKLEQGAGFQGNSLAVVSLDAKQISDLLAGGTCAQDLITRCEQACENWLDDESRLLCAPYILAFEFDLASLAQDSQKRIAIQNPGQLSDWFKCCAAQKDRLAGALYPLDQSLSERAFIVNLTSLSAQELASCIGALQKTLETLQDTKACPASVLIAQEQVIACENRPDRPGREALQSIGECIPLILEMGVAQLESCSAAQLMHFIQDYGVRGLTISDGAPFTS